MASTLDLAILAGTSYNDTRSAINRFPVPLGWTLYSAVPSDDQTGFEARAFQSGSEIVISYSGTDPNNSGLFTSPDGITNRFLAAGYMAEQLIQAAEYYLQIKNAPENTNKNITLTGHSLGGGLAALVGVFFGVHATTFDQAPFARSALDQNDNNAAQLLTRLTAKLDGNGQPLYSASALQGLADYLQLRSAGPVGNIPRQNLIDTIRVQGEFLDGGLLGNSSFGNTPIFGEDGDATQSGHRLTMLFIAVCAYSARNRGLNYQIKRRKIASFSGQHALNRPREKTRAARLVDRHYNEKSRSVGRRFS
jgi:Lipase (class 3)